MRDLTLAIAQTETKKRHSNPANVLRWNFAIIASILILGLVYLFQINDLGTKGYAIGTLQTKATDLKAEQKQLEVRASELRSITRIQEQAQARSFVPIAGGVNYINDGGVALK